MDKLIDQIEQIKKLLEEIEEFLDDQSDADTINGKLVPNKAMRLLTKVQEILNES